MTTHVQGGAVVGATLGLASMAVPDGVASFLGKVAVGASVALVSGAIHALVSYLSKRWLKTS